MSSRPRLFILVAPFVLVSAGFLASCGEAESATTSSIQQIGPTNYATLPPTESTSTTTTVAGGQAAGTVTTEVTEYTVQTGDVPFTVATRFKVTLDALNLANVDTQGFNIFYPGLVIKIPAGATIPDPSTLPTQPAGGGESTTTVAGLGDNCKAGSYVIQEGDIPSTVANKFNVTVAQLDAANVNTPGYKGFILGITIIIPAKENCA